MRHVEGRAEKNRSQDVENTMPPYLKLLYKSIPRRMKAEIDAKEGHTK